MAVTTLAGNVYGVLVMSVPVDPPNVGAATTADLMVTIPGLRTTDIVCAQFAPGPGNGYGMAGFYVSAADTLTIRWINPTAGAINPATITMLLAVFRPESGTLPSGVAF